MKIILSAIGYTLAFANFALGGWLLYGYASLGWWGHFVAVLASIMLLVMFLFISIFKIQDYE